MQTTNKLLTFIAMIALLVGIVACAAPAVSPTVTPPAGETGGTTDSDSGPVDDSNGLAMNDLMGTWNAVTIDGNPVNEQVVPTLIFDGAGMIAGEGGCNGYGGTYKAEGHLLMIEGVISTMMACEDQTLMTQETTFFAAIQRTASFTIEGTMLTLEDADGNAIVTLTRAA